MPTRRYERREPTNDWQQLRPLLKDSAQLRYEVIRLVVLWGQTPKERAAATGVSQRTIYSHANLFDQVGMAFLLPPVPLPTLPVHDKRALPPPIHQEIVDLVAEYPAFRPHELATICFLQFGQRPSPQTIKLILASGPKPSRTRCFKRFAEMDDPVERRRIIVRLHAEGWNAQSIAGYLETSRTTVHSILKKWAQEQFAGIAEHSRAPHHPAQKVTLRTMHEIKKLAHNPDLGAYRVSAALEQMGIKLSRAVLASAISRQQDTEAYFAVFYAAIRKYGLPEILVSDSGSMFVSHEAERVYDTLGIEKKEIQKGRPWQNYIETLLRRMADWHFERAQSWEDLLAAHEKRTDGCSSPAEVLGWIKGMQPNPQVLYRAFSAVGEIRTLNKAGYAKFRNYLLYGERGLAGQETLVNIFQDVLTLEYQEQPLSRYSVEWQPDDRHLLRIGNPRLYDHTYQSAQPSLWEPTDVEWYAILRCDPPLRKKHRDRSVVIQLPLLTGTDGW